MSTKAFIAAREALSPIQKEAAEWDEGALLVLAGPGAGKTRVLTCDNKAADGMRLSASRDTERVHGEPTFVRPNEDALQEWAGSFSPGRLYTMGRLTSIFEQRAHNETT